VPIRIDNIEKSNPLVTRDEQNPRPGVLNEYTYKDLSFDLEFDTDSGNVPVNRVTNVFDLKDLRDAKDIKQSLTNLFNTSPGQRLTNPFFGINLQKFLFDPVNQITADLIGRTILENVTEFEPRIKIDHLDVLGYPDQGEYQISFAISFRDSSIVPVKLNGALNNRGFIFDGDI